MLRAAQAHTVFGGSSSQESETNLNTYTGRSKLFKDDSRSNPLGKKIFETMEQRKTNLCFSPDVYKAADLLRLADLVGPHICVLKTHIDLIEDFTPDLIVKLQGIAQKHGFIIFEDRKFADIGKTVVGQYEGGMYKIARWAKLTNAHTVPGPGIIEGLKQVNTSLKLNNGLLLLAEMSSKGNLATGSYTTDTVAMAEAHMDFVVGFIGRRKLSERAELITFTPGVQFKNKEGKLGQQYITPEEAIEAGTDVIIVGSGIPYEAYLTAKIDYDAGVQYYNEHKEQQAQGSDRGFNTFKAAQTTLTQAEEAIVATAKDYQEAAWIAYEKRAGIYVEPTQKVTMGSFN